jgi:DNA repair protein RadC
MKLQNSYLAAQLFRQHVKSADREELWLVNLTENLDLIDFVPVARGGLEHVVISTRDVFRIAMTHGAQGIVLLHNHPSGRCEPSFDDYRSTKRILLGCRHIGISLVDHVIVTETRHFSFADQVWGRRERHLAERI